VLDLRVDDEWTIAQHGSLMSRHIVWYVPGSVAASLLDDLPEDLEPRALGEPAPPDLSETTGVLLVDVAGSEADRLAAAKAQPAGLPVVAVIDESSPHGPGEQPCYAYVSPRVSSRTLAAVLRQACAHARVMSDAIEMRTQLEELNTIGIRLSAERNLDALLELILTKGREITRSDAGSLYVVEPTPEGGKRLRFKLAQNDSVRVEFRESTLPISADSVAGYAALAGEILRIDDAYALPPDSPFHINTEFDAKIGYRTTSMLVVPMKTPAGETIGVLQLINCKRVPHRPFASREAIQAETLPYPERYRNLAASLASQAGVAIHNARLFHDLAAALQEVEASQQQLVQAERLSALGEMAAGVAHDFNNLLAVVVGRAEILLAKGQDSSVTRDVEIIRTAAWDGANTVRRIQEFTRTRRVRTASQVDVPALLRDVVELTKVRWKDEAQSRGISYEVVVEGGTDSPVAGISAELREVFMNLLINGLDAMPGGGQFVFRISDDANTVIVAAEDTGSGMSEETRRRVLEPFFTTKGARGTGLGLAVSWGIVKRHGGTIEIESTVGMGSIFTIRLPISSGDSAPDVAETTVRQVRSGRILVIDDELEVRCVLRDMLTPCGHTVIEADSGETGLALLDREAVDIILTDISMPGMSGWDVAAACQRRLPQIPLGFVTGWGDRLDEQETARAGVRFIVSKPFAPADVQGHVADALASPAP
jgi:signal transduction histidine kinase/ActR/RegA family two-component response regulator